MILTVVFQSRRCESRAKGTYQKTTPPAVRRGPVILRMHIQAFYQLSYPGPLRVTTMTIIEWWSQWPMTDDLLVTDWASQWLMKWVMDSSWTWSWSDNIITHSITASLLTTVSALLIFFTHSHWLNKWQTLVSNTDDWVTSKSLSQWVTAEMTTTMNYHDLHSWSILLSDNTNWQ